MIINRLLVGDIGTNCYIVSDETKSAALIDPGGDAPLILRTLKKSGLEVKAIILTHGHYDHIGAAGALAEATGAKICLHGQDEILLVNPSVNLSGLFSREISFDFKIERQNDGDIISAGDLDFTVIHTPGHTPGSISLKIEDLLFSGDLLFAGSIGRTDFPYGSLKVLSQSLKKVMSLPDETRILPGHGDPSTIGQERLTNPFITHLFD